MVFYHDLQTSMLRRHVFKIIFFRISRKFWGDVSSVLHQYWYMQCVTRIDGVNCHWYSFNMFCYFLFSVNVRTAPVYRLHTPAKPRGRPLSTASVIYLGGSCHRRQGINIFYPYTKALYSFECYLQPCKSL